MTIAVTAVSGQLGGEIAKALLAVSSDQSDSPSDLSRDTPVIGLARTPKKAQGLGVEVRPGDYSQPKQLEQSLTGVEVLLLVSGIDPPDERIQQHRNVIEAARSAGVRKIVYTSIQGPETGTRFSPVVQSNRQTEADVRDSGLDWAIGRNGIYIEPDIEYIDRYRKRGEIANCAGDGKCGYTTRAELAYAYSRLLTCSEYDGKTVNLHGTPITQVQLTDYLNQRFGTKLEFRSMTVADYVEDRTAELGPFMGEIIAGIYEGIRIGANDNVSDFASVAGRAHLSWDEYFRKA